MASFTPQPRSTSKPWTGDQCGPAAVSIDQHQPSQHQQKEVVEEKQPWAYLSCGHVHGYHNWGHRSDHRALGRDVPCAGQWAPTCRSWLGCEAGLHYVDAGPPTHAFTPCGRVCSEKSAKYWSQIRCLLNSRLSCRLPFLCHTAAWGTELHQISFQGPVD